MIIKSIHIANYGKLKNFSLELRSGVNIIEGKNESGKSTLCDFIKFIFYGMSQESEERARAFTWGSSSCSGNMVVADATGEYRIEREAMLVKSTDGRATVREKLGVFDAETGKPTFKNAVPGEVFFGIPRDIFESTAFIGQLPGTRSGGEALAEASENILFSADENINTKKALKKLDEARVYLYYKNKKGGKIYDLIAEREALSEKLETAKKNSAEIISLEGTVRASEESRESARAKLEKVNTKLAAYERYGIKKMYKKLVEEKRRSREAAVRINALSERTRYKDAQMNDVSFIELLKKERGDLLFLESEKRSAEGHVDATKRKLTGMNEKLGNFSRMGEEESRDELIAFAENARKGAASAGKMMLIFFLLGAALTVTALVLLVLKTLWFIPAGLAVPALIAAFERFIQKNKMARTEEKIYARFGCGSYEEFCELREAAMNDTIAISIIKGSLTEAEDKVSVCEKTLEEKRESVRALLAENDFAVTENIFADIENAAAKAREGSEALEKVIKEKERADERVAEIASSLSAYGEDEVKKAVEESFDEEKMESFDLAGKKRERDFLMGSISSLTEKIHTAECSLASLYVMQQKPSEIAQSIAADEAKIASLSEKFAAIVLAIESINNAGEALRDSVAPHIATTASSLMSHISGGKYGTLFVDSDFSVRYGEDGVTRDISALSAGTTDIAYISLRLALVDLLCKKTLPPFVFDESFSRVDEGRLVSALKLLDNAFGKGAQTLILSCHDREKRAAEKLAGANFVSI